jgi:hypothetical protein
MNRAGKKITLTETVRQKRLMDLLNKYGLVTTYRPYELDGRTVRLTPSDFRYLANWIKQQPNIVDCSVGLRWRLKLKEFQEPKGLQEDDIVARGKNGKMYTVRQIKFLIEKFKLKAQAAKDVQKRAYLWRQHFRLKELLNDQKRKNSDSKVVKYSDGNDIETGCSGSVDGGDVRAGSERVVQGHPSSDGQGRGG